MSHTASGGVDEAAVRAPGNGATCAGTITVMCAAAVVAHGLRLSARTENMTRHLYSVAVLLSLVASAAAVVCWVRSFGDGDRVRLEAWGGQYEVRSTRGRVVVLATPRGPAADEARARDCARRLRAEDVGWVVHGPPPDRWCGTGPWTGLSSVEQAGSAAADMKAVPSVAVLRPMLAALDDPDRFAAAHALLTARFGKGRGCEWEEGMDEAGVAHCNGLSIVMGSPVATYTRDDGGVDTVYDGRWRADAAQRTAVSAAWLDRFSPPVLSVRYSAVVGLGMVLSLGWFVSTLVRIRRSGMRDAGLCLKCGYDLRATPRRCPECGGTREGV